MLAAIAGIFTSDCDKCVWAAACLNTLNTNTHSELALGICVSHTFSLQKEEKKQLCIRGESCVCVTVRGLLCDCSRGSRAGPL